METLVDQNYNHQQHRLRYLYQKTINFIIHLNKLEFSLPKAAFETYLVKIDQVDLMKKKKTRYQFIFIIEYNLNYLGKMHDPSFKNKILYSLSDELVCVQFGWLENRQCILVFSIMSPLG